LTLATRKFGGKTAERSFEIQHGSGMPDLARHLGVGFLARS
jgi:hypothetical protein